MSFAVGHPTSSPAGGIIAGLHADRDQLIRCNHTGAGLVGRHALQSAILLDLRSFCRELTS